VRRLLRDYLLGLVVVVPLFSLIAIIGGIPVLWTIAFIVVWPVMWWVMEVLTFIGESFSGRRR
jgi:hypothetical protein